MIRLRPFVLFVALSGCVGTDFIDDDIVDERITINNENLSLIVGGTVAMSGAYYNKYGIETPVKLKWTSSGPAIARVDEEGIVTALGAGKAMIEASFGSARSFVNIIVVENAEQVAEVEITLPSSDHLNLDVGESIRLAIVVKNINDETLPGRTVNWVSEHPSIATVNDGNVTGISEGIAEIHAEAEGVKSNSLMFTVGGGMMGGGSRTGTFMGASGYKAKGEATLTVDGGNVTLSLSADFQTSFALGTFIYMANTTNGRQVKANGREVAEITMGGAHSFNLSSIDPNISLMDYEYVIVLCKPASITFGSARLN